MFLVINQLKYGGPILRSASADETLCREFSGLFQRKEKALDLLLVYRCVDHPSRDRMVTAATLLSFEALFGRPFQFVGVVTLLLLILKYEAASTPITSFRSLEIFGLCSPSCSPAKTYNFPQCLLKAFILTHRRIMTPCHFMTQ